MLQVLDKVNAQTTTLTVKVGQAGTYGSLTIAVQACVIRPPTLPQDAAAFLDDHRQPPRPAWLQGLDAGIRPVAGNAGAPALRRPGDRLHAMSLDKLPPFAASALLLDFDGTLVDLAPTPDAVVVAPGFRETLRRLRDRLGGALAVITGRPVETVDALLGDAPYAVAGEHGGAVRHAPGEALIRPSLPSPAAANGCKQRSTWSPRIPARCWNARPAASRCISAPSPRRVRRCTMR